MNFDNQELKPRDQITEADERNRFFVVEDPEFGRRQQSLDDLYAVVSQIKLDTSVPEHIRSHFAQAQNLAVYSWFHYPFNVTAQFMGFVTVEYPLKHLYDSRSSFKVLIRRAVDEGRIQDEGFAVAKTRENTEERYVETLVRVMPDLRNKLAHGSNMLHNSGLSSLRICADFINQLFPEHTPNNTMESDA